MDKVEQNARARCLAAGKDPDAILADHPHTIMAWEIHIVASRLSTDAEVLRGALEQVVLACEDAAYACAKCSTTCGPVKAINEIHEIASSSLSPTIDSADGGAKS